MTNGASSAVRLIAGVSLLALLAAPAVAQEVSPEPEMQTGSGIQDIVVTAQRREERSQTVPVAVTAFSPERLQDMNVTEAQDLYGSVPSLVVGSQGQSSRDVQSYSIRGQATGFLSAPAVAVYFAEVPLPATVNLALQGGPGQFVDVENIQVLAGPQGTLFGRNTTGGAVLLSPKKPGSEFGGYLEGQLGNYSLRSIEGALNVPLIEDKLMVRVSGAFRDRRGYTKDLVWNKWRDDTHWYSGRMSILFKPTDRLENNLIVYGARSSTNGAGHIHKGFNIAGLAARGMCVNGGGIPGGVPSCNVYQAQTVLAKQIGPRRNRMSVDAFAEIETWGVINNLGYEISDALTFRSITSFQKLKTGNAMDEDGTPLQQQEGPYSARLPDFTIAGFSEYGFPATSGNTYQNGDTMFSHPGDFVKQFTQELQLQGHLLDRRLTFTVGGFYYDSSPVKPWGSRQFANVPLVETGIRPATEFRVGVGSKSKALYGQVTLDLGAVTPALDKLRITGGYRYTWDSVTGFAGSWTPVRGAGTANCLIGGGFMGNVALSEAAEQCTFGAKLKSSAPTWTVGLDYRPVDNAMLYAKVSHGYKSGGFNTFAVKESSRQFAPEKLTSYELGIKSDWKLGDIPLRLNATYYYSNYKNIQRPAADFNPVTGRAGAQILAASAKIQGLEFEGTIKPFDWLEVGGNMSYTDPKYKSFTQVAPFGAVACNGTIPAGGLADYSCVPFAFVTRWMYNVHASLQLPIPEDLGRLSLFASYSHVSSQATAPNALPVMQPGSVLEPYGLLNLSLDWRNVAQSGVDVGLFATNVTNKLYRVSNANVFDGSLHHSTMYGEPRMMGVKVRYRFGSE